MNLKSDSRGKIRFVVAFSTRKDKLTPYQTNISTKTSWRLYSMARLAFLDWVKMEIDS